VIHFMRRAGATTSALGTVVLLTWGARASAQAIPRNEICINCHRDLSDERLARPARDFPQDIHASLGFGCLDCHGPNSLGSNPTDPRLGFLRAPDRRFIPRLCGRCHSDAAFMRQYNPSLRVDQEAEYATSRHGKLLASRNDPNVAVCTSCHPAHAIRPPSDAQSTVYPLNVAATCGHCHADEQLMAPYGIPTDQRAEYEKSTHWRWMSEEGDVSAPSCNDCHGNHGAAPPGVSSVRNVCGQCHSIMANYFGGSKHDEYFSSNNLPGCVTCHGNHQITTPTDDLLLVANDSVCRDCHDQDDVGAHVFPQMRELLDSLTNELHQTEGILDKAANAGMEVSQAQFDLQEVNTSMVKARAAVHSFTVDSLRQQLAASQAVATSAYERGESALGEHLFRRQGLAVSVVLIVLSILGLLLKIRQLERVSGDATPRASDPNVR
jgi:predicted CXXCH cytochrome family protein